MESFLFLFQDIWAINWVEGFKNAKKKWEEIPRSFVSVASISGTNFDKITGRLPTKLRSKTQSLNLSIRLRHHEDLNPSHLHLKPGCAKTRGSALAELNWSAQSHPLPATDISRGAGRCKFRVADVSLDACAGAYVPKTGQHKRVLVANGMNTWAIEL